MLFFRKPQQTDQYTSQGSNNQVLTIGSRSTAPSTGGFYMRSLAVWERDLASREVNGIYLAGKYPSIQFLVLTCTSEEAKCIFDDFWVAFYLSGLSGPTSQFSNGTHEFSELVLARMALLMDQSRASSTALVGQSAGICGGRNFKNWPNQFFSVRETEQMENDLSSILISLVRNDREQTFPLTD